MGDPVWLSIPHGGVSRKLASKWEGEWHIIEMKSPASAKIRNREGSTRVVHINRLQHRILRYDGLLNKAHDDQLNDLNYKLSSESFKRNERAISRIPVQDSSMSTPEVRNIPKTTEGSNENTLEERECEGSIQEPLNYSVDNPSGGFEISSHSMGEDTSFSPMEFPNPINNSPGKWNESLNRGLTTPLKSPVRRSQRNRRLPKYLGDYVVD